MKQTSLFTLVITACVLASTASAAQPSTACDRECLRGKVSELLYAFVKHDVSKIKVAPTLRVTEDAIVKPLANVGLVKSVTGLAGYRQDIIDERMGVSGAHVIVKEGDTSVMLVVRVKVVANALTEVELVANRGGGLGAGPGAGPARAAGAGPGPGPAAGPGPAVAGGPPAAAPGGGQNRLLAPSEATSYVPRPEQLMKREDAIKIALKYPEGLASARNFAAVNLPFSPDAYRFENGMVLAGPECTFNPTCKNISTQSLAVFERLGDPVTRIIAVDERMGIVWLRMAWGVAQEGGDQLCVWETFKIYDGQMHAVEAFMRTFPIELRNGGWE
jgi:hypothetical protein